MTQPSPRVLRRICVFTGSRDGARPAYAEGARALGKVLAERKIGLVYGGGSVGLMGILADAVQAAGGEVIGVIPDWLVKKEVAHKGLADLRVVGSMHERKALMADLSDAFVAMPGGFGTFDELFEILTWAQIALHDKPIGLLDVDGFFTAFAGFVSHLVREGFVGEEHTRMYVQRAEAGQLVDALAAFAPPALGRKWEIAKT